jgi:hypothetical protein
MSSNNTQPVEIENPVLIDRLKATETKGGSPQISLYSGALEFPVLNLAPFSYGLLFDVGFDPNEITPGRTYYTRFFAQWEEGEKANKNGNPYKNVTRLIPGNRENDNLLREMQTIKTLVTFIAEQQAGSREALIEWYKSREGKG